MRTLKALSLSLFAAAAVACEESGATDSRGFDTGAPMTPLPMQEAGGPQPDAGVNVDAASANDAAGSSVPKDAGGQDAGAQDANVGTRVLSSVAGGAVSALPDAGAAGVNAKGAALLVRTVTGHGLVSLQVSGLGAGKTYPTHVHAAPCATGAGGHYMFDPDAGADAGQSNEVWPTLMTDDAGQARAFVDVAMVLREDAKAIVVHDPDASNAKMLCADLTVKSPFTTSGTANPLAGADAGVAIMASGTMTRGDDGKTTVRVEVQMLKPSTMYMIHVHDQACAAANGGGHYKLDYGMTAAVESNEIWLNLTTDATGRADKTVVVDHVARAEAQAIVIHAADNTRLACIDLKP